jgi:hypothetical protein
MSTFRALLVAVLLTLLAPFAPASAGGPTSALLSVPGEGRTASVYYTDPDYEELSDLVGGTGIASRTIDDSGETHEVGPGVTVTWLIHDVQVWRVDRIYPAADGSPWIATQEMDFDTGTIWDSPVVWHRAVGGKQLTTLLDRLLGGQSSAPQPAPAKSETPAAAPAPAPAESSNGARWGLGGLAAGVLLTLGWLRVRPKREAERELDPGLDWLAPQTRSTSA